MPSQVQPTQPQASEVTAVIEHLLQGRTDAVDIIVSAASRLGLTAALQLFMPSPVDQQGLATSPEAANRASCAKLFAHWHDLARSRRRLIDLANSFQTRRAGHAQRPPVQTSPPVQITGASTWSEKDAALRLEGVSLSSTSSLAGASASAAKAISSVLPFETSADLPPSLSSHKESNAIVRVLTSRTDRTLTKWRRRSMYTAENWARWAAWNEPGCVHRDRMATGNIFMDPSSILIAPGLRSADSEIAAEAWNVYRRQLQILILQALGVGFPWPDILVRLSSTYSDHSSGYPRLVNYINAALEDLTLIDWPLLHANVLLYQLDCSYAAGSHRYTADSNSVDWDAADSRLNGEDPMSLARRVTNGFITMHDNEALTDVTVWDWPAFVNDINNRYSACLRNDLADPVRGASSSSHFLELWAIAQAKHDDNPSRGKSFLLSCEHLARTGIAPRESATALFTEPAVEELPPSGSLPRLTHRGGLASRSNRTARRAAERDEEYPGAYQLPTLPEHR